MRFDPSTTQTLQSLGWTIAGASAELAHGKVRASVHADGRWRVRRGAVTLASGKESHPALAACDANEIVWNTAEYRAAEAADWKAEAKHDEYIRRNQG